MNMRPQGIWPSYADTKNSWLRIGGSNVKLPRLRMGDAKTVKSRTLVDRDLIFVQSTWPRERSYHCQFGRLRKGERITYATKFKTAVEANLGLPVVLKLRADINGPGRELFGYIHTIIYTEYDNCTTGIEFTLDAYDEQYPGRLAV